MNIGASFAGRKAKEFGISGHVHNRKLIILKFDYQKQHNHSISEIFLIRCNKDSDRQGAAIFQPDCTTPSYHAKS